MIKRIMQSKKALSDRTLLVRACGFTLVEIIFAMALLAIATLIMFSLNRLSNQTSMDSYYESLAFSLAREPLEVFRGFGYESLRLIADGNVSAPAPYNDYINKMENVEFGVFSPVKYPSEALMFKRMIELESVSHGEINGILVRVTVAPKDSSRVDIWMRSRTVSLESLVMEHMR